MTFEELALAAGVVFSGLWSGLLATLTTIMHPMLKAMDGRGFRNFMGGFLAYARKAWFNYICASGMAIAPIVALIALWGDWSTAPFVLTVIALAVVIFGVYVVSNVWKEPLYDVILSWDPDAVPADWQTTQARYFTINWIQAISTWTVLALLLAALLLL
ncbi:hypothetical protein ACWCOV_19650 [Kribbella sp. NPDC002412]